VRTHILELFDPLRLGVSFLGEFESVSGMFQGAIRMPLAGGVVSLFIVLRGGAMGLRCQIVVRSGFLVLLGGFPAFFVHGVPPVERAVHLLAVHAASQSLISSE
jgi:hypothetical protein